ncbi:helix-turn-helix transcriptional regulator [Dietzia maris]|uniref:Helix-turn-helix domain-containing protein n=1 Tax=Dietzia maris TaxID=37915 RepID=A0ABT8GYL3_9ACTN|nr:helix-turn-helix domain-containing protein [Dietzia maris]MCZ4539854.1 helix-turn-helix domain-containing protein [Dietzia maris]MDN4505306.1 helix-turn-helix domain-containing protein [Dietzia maris]
MSGNGLIAAPALAQEFGVTVQRLATWRHQGVGPAYVKVGRLVRYRREDVDAWLDAQTVETAGGAA